MNFAIASLLLAGGLVFSAGWAAPAVWAHYTFIFIGTDLDPKALPPGLTRDQLFTALAGHTKGAVGLIGRFRHPS
jgi:hypothetical protein